MSIKIVSTTALLVLLTFLRFHPSPAWSGENAPPAGCAGSGFRQKGGQVVLNPGAGDKEGLFLLHNVSDETLQVTHPVAGGTASAGWTSEIGPGRWSAFAAEGEDFALACMRFADGNVKTLRCEDVLGICELPNAKMPADLSGSFWVSEDKNREGVVAEIKSRGISWGK